MTRPTIRQLQADIKSLQTANANLVVDLEKENETCNAKFREVTDLHKRIRELVAIADAERKEVVWLRSRMDETAAKVMELRQRIGFAVDCVGGRPGGECGPMGRKMHVGVGAILVYAVDNCAGELAHLSNRENCEAHKFIRRELPPIAADRCPF